MRKFAVKALLVCSLVLFIPLPLYVAATPGQWSATGSTIYYNDGSVSIGSSSTSAKLSVSGNDANVNTNTINVGVTADRHWEIINGKYANEGNGNYPLTFYQPSYSGCSNCKGDLILRPGRHLSIPYAKVGIGTLALDDYRLAVNGAIHAKELVVSNSGWADYVFDKDYDLMSLADVESFIEKNKHLPGIPAGSEIEGEGLPVGEMQKLHMQKIEELTLYIIQQNKEMEELKARLDKLETN